jgi:hypothetical protein
VQSDNLEPGLEDQLGRGASDTAGGAAGKSRWPTVQKLPEHGGTLDHNGGLSPSPRTTKLDLRPTALLPDVHGNVEVACKCGHTEIKVKLDDITPASVLGPGYLTYVLWAITPDGQTMNLTELQPYESDKVDIVVMVDLPVFGLIITAEPYFAVTQPSDAIAVEIGGIPDEACFRNLTVNYELLELGQYSRISLPGK